MITVYETMEAVYRVHWTLLVFPLTLIYLFLGTLTRSLLLYDRFGFGWFTEKSYNDTETTVWLGIFWPATWAVIFVILVGWAGLKLGRWRPKKKTALPKMTIVDRDER